MLGSALCLPLDQGASWRSTKCCCLLNQSSLSAATCHQEVVPAVLLMWRCMSSPGLNWPACLALTLSGLAFSCTHHALPLQSRLFPRVAIGSTWLRGCVCSSGGSRTSPGQFSLAVVNACSSPPSFPQVSSEF